MGANSVESGADFVEAVHSDVLVIYFRASLGVWSAQMVSETQSSDASQPRGHKTKVPMTPGPR